MTSELYRDPDFAPESVLEAVEAEDAAGVTEATTGLEGGLRPEGFAYRATLEMDRTTVDRALDIMATQELDFNDLTLELREQLEPLFEALNEIQQITGIEITSLDSPEAQNSFMAAMQDPSILGSLDRAGLYQLSLKLGNMPSLGALGPNMRSWTLSESRDGASFLQSTVAANYAGRQAVGGRVDLGDKAGGIQIPDATRDLVMTRDDINDAMTKGPNMPQQMPGMSLAS